MESPSTGGVAGVSGGQSLALRVQKKVAGKLGSRGLAKRFISDSTARLLDSTYEALCLVFGKKESEKVVKGMIKTVGKVAVLEKNGQLSGSRRVGLDAFVSRFRNLVLTVVSFVQVEYSYDRAYLTRSVRECESELRGVVAGELTEKSLSRISFVFRHLADPAFLDALFLAPNAAPPAIPTQRSPFRRHRPRRPLISLLSYSSFTNTFWSSPMSQFFYDHTYTQQLPIRLNPLSSVLFLLRIRYVCHVHVLYCSIIRKWFGTIVSTVLIKLLSVIIGTRTGNLW